MSNLLSFFICLLVLLKIQSLPKISYLNFQTLYYTGLPFFLLHRLLTFHLIPDIKFPEKEVFSLHN